MNNLITTLLFSSITVFTQGQTKTLIIKTEILCCHCVNCGSCGPNIYKYVTEDEGVKKFALDVDANKIFIMYDSLITTPEKIRKAIIASGYDADNRKTPFQNPCKSKSCCNKKTYYWCKSAKHYFVE